MDNPNRQVNKATDNLGVNKMGKNIKKSPIHQPNFANAAKPQQPQPQVYNIDKNNFRNMVQQLTGSPSHHQEPVASRPPQNPSKPSSMRLQKIRPPPLAPIHRPYVPVQAPVPVPASMQPQPVVSYNNNLMRPPQQYGQPSPPIMPPFTPGDAWVNTAESPISAYMRYLQNSIMDPGSRPTTPQGQPQLHSRPCTQPEQPVPGLLPNPPMAPLPSPRFNGLPPVPSPRMNGPPLPYPQNGPPPPLPYLQYGAPPPLPSPQMNRSSSSFPSPQMSAPPLLLSPTSQFLLPSPNGFWNMGSPCAWLSPGFRHPPPFTPNFSFSPMGGQSGILGPGPQAPPSPNSGFPLSPNGLFPVVSPRWRNQ